MKTKSLLKGLSVFALTLSLGTGNSQILINYWDFNATPPAGGGGKDSLGNATNTLPASYTTEKTYNPHIIYYRPYSLNMTADSTLDNGSPGAYDIYNYQSNPKYGIQGDTAGSTNCFVRMRNPSPGNDFIIYLPTKGYKNIELEFAFSVSSTKGSNIGFSYSTNSGASWNALTSAMDTFNTSGKYHPDSLQMVNSITSGGTDFDSAIINFSSDPTVNNNPNFVVKWSTGGPNNILTSGNNRFDNIALIGDTNGPSGIENITQNNGGYNLYPNPATENITVTGNSQGLKLITIYDVSGKSIGVSEMTNDKTTINISNLSAGSYMMEIKETGTSNKYILPFVKQ